MHTKIIELVGFNGMRECEILTHCSIDEALDIADIYRNTGRYRAVTLRLETQGRRIVVPERLAK